MNQKSIHTVLFSCSRKFVQTLEISLHIYVLALEYYNAPQAKIFLRCTGDTWNQEVRCTGDT